MNVFVNWVIIGWGNGLVAVRYQAIFTWTNVTEPQLKHQVQYEVNTEVFFKQNAFNSLRPSDAYIRQ